MSMEDACAAFEEIEYEEVEQDPEQAAWDAGCPYADPECSCLKRDQLTPEALP